MTKEEWDNIREEICESLEKYRDRHGQWNIAYHASVLAICGVYIALCSISEVSDNIVVATLRIFAVILSIGCGLAVMKNIMTFVEMYRSLGYQDVVDHPNQLDAQVENAQRIHNEFKKKVQSVEDTEKLSRRLLKLSTGCLCISLGFEYLSLLCPS